ncbi:FAD/NAD(P)-binding domain-containing protein [Hypomontagnella monticulosa]|nr:FAD/NAD(P)-binding domain-containing protein [Hypomontagnella monticulosa]
MADPKSFRVIIAGGGIAGLVLANALEKAGVDFILLEKHDIAPQIGASIIIQCHTGKVFDQLGVWEQMCAATFPLTGRLHFDEHSRLFEDSPIFKLVREKTGIPILLMERRFCLDTLYNNIKDKSRLHTNVAVTSFLEDEDGINVITNRGENIKGSILVAADGVHSTIRTLLADSNTIDTKRRENLIGAFTSNYRTLFGISTNWLGNDTTRPLFPAGVVHHVYYRNVSGITAAGAKGYVFWFLFIKEDESSRMPNCPRYTDADAVDTIERYGHLSAKPGYTFRDLWDTKIKAGMTNMEEGVVKGPWNNGGRVVLIGDAICKTTVNSGFGGNLAVEGVCTLVNELLSLLEITQIPTANDIVSVFERYERIQRPRAEISVAISNRTTRYESIDSLWLRLQLWLSPWIPQSHKVRSFLSYMAPAPIFNFLPGPNNPQAAGG